MAWGGAASLGSAQEKVSDGSLTLTVTASSAAGDVLVAFIGFDSAGTGGPNTNLLSVTDSAGNTWNRILEAQDVTGTETFALGALFYSNSTAALTSGSSTVTVSISTNVTAKSFEIYKFTMAAGSTAEVISTSYRTHVLNAGTDPSAITLSSLTNQEYLWLHVLSGEGPNTDAYTWDADYTAIAGNGTTSGGAASNIHVRGGYRIFTGTTDTVDVTSTTADRDYAQVYCALHELPGVTGYRKPIIISQARQRTATR